MEANTFFIEVIAIIIQFLLDYIVLKLNSKHSKKIYGKLPFEDVNVKKLLKVV